uniref:Uncharacterized protein n=1 Tax=Romanomermis culicivorax TaxID=13658 RepID=A0A915JTZ7_ROMCU
MQHLFRTTRSFSEFGSGPKFGGRRIPFLRLCS